MTTLHLRSELKLLPIVSLLLLLVMTPFTALGSVRVVHLANPTHTEFFNAALRKLAEEFNALQTDIEVVVETATGDYIDKVMTMLAAGTPPDVIHAVHNHGAIFMASKSLADINELARRDGVDLKRHIVPQSLAALQWEGVQFGLPIFGQPISVFYNRSLFDTAGITPPADQHRQGVWTWDAYLATAKKLTQDLSGDGQPDTYGTAISASLDRFPIWIWQAGGDLFDKAVNPTQATFMTQPVLNTLEWYVGWKTVHNVAGGNMIQGTQGMNPFQHPGDVPYYRDVAFDWDVAPMAKGPVDDITAVFMNNVQVTAASPHKQEAWKWVKHIALDVKSVSRLIDASARTPVLREAFAYYLSSTQVPPNRSIWFDQLNNARSVALSNKVTDLQRLIPPQVTRMINGEIPVREGLTILEPQINALLRKR